LKLKKVVILGSAYPLRGGGIATFNERLAQAFMDEDYQVTIYSFSLQYPKILFPGKTQISNEDPPENLDIKVRVNSINPFNWWKIGRELKNLKPDLIVVRFWIPFMAPCLGTISSIARKNKQTRVVAIADNVIPHEKRPFDNALTKYFIKRMDGFVTMSKSVKADLQGFNVPESIIETCPHPLYDNLGYIVERDDARKALKINNEDKVILFFGFIRDYKGLDLLFKAMASKELDNINIKVVVAGEFYCNPKPYYEMVEKLNIGHKVVWHDNFIPNKEVGVFFSAANLVVQPYKNATQSGVTQLAYHFNRPMVVTNVGALPEMVSHQKGGYVVNPDPEEIANAIKAFFVEDKEAQFSDFAKKEKKRFSWKNMVQSIELVASKSNS